MKIKKEEYYELSKIRNTDAGRDLPGVRLPYQPSKEKEKILQKQKAEF